MNKIIPIIEKLGGKKQFLRALIKYRPEIYADKTINMLYHWERRGRISSLCMHDVMKIAELNNIPYCAADFISCDK